MFRLYQKPGPTAPAFRFCNVIVNQSKDFLQPLEKIIYQINMISHTNQMMVSKRGCEKVVYILFQLDMDLGPAQIRVSQVFQNLSPGHKIFVCLSRKLEDCNTFFRNLAPYSYSYSGFEMG